MGNKAKDHPLSILITAGGTIEDIDTVRGISNHASGRLGSLIADEFSQSGANVTFLCGESSLRPSHEPHRQIVIRNTAQLATCLEQLLRESRFDCVIHSMAVSDFSPHTVIGIDDFARCIEKELSKACLSQEKIAQAVQSAISKSVQRPAEKKISSKSSHLMLILKQNSKAISMIKNIQPNTMLVGFKLLSGADEPELVSAGAALLEQTGSDLVLANDISDISGESHKGVLLDACGIVCRADTKSEIAKMIFSQICERLE